MSAPSRLALAAPLMILAVACETQKSANWLAPTVAGPIPGINITPPSPVNPKAGARVPVSSQPITLIIGNSLSNGPRPLSYVFEVATDAGFANKLISRDNIAPGVGQTSLRLPDALATGRTYYWRSRAQDGANASPFAAPISFTVFTPVVIQAPVPVSPTNNATVGGRRPTMTWANAVRTGPAGPLAYQIEVADNTAFTIPFDAQGVFETPSQTSFRLTRAAPLGERLFWRVRGYDTANTANVGPWSATWAFRIPDSVGGAPGAPCGPPYPSTGPEVVACVAARYPAQIAASGDANLIFLRDRIIETGICGGMDLGWNRKTDGSISVDAIAWRHGITDVVDIGSRNAPPIPISLHWLIVGGVPGYVSYSPRPTCN